MQFPILEGAFNKQRALGNDLLGNGLYPGYYEPNASESAQSPPRDASGWTDTQLIITKQLNVDGTDGASIGIFANGPTPLYGNDSASVRDDGYERMVFDVSSSLDGRPSVGVTFSLVADEQTQAAGWTIDDVIFKDGTLPDYDACGGCVQAPSFAGASSATDNNRCGADGVTVSWHQATSWGSGGGGSYAVYRDTVPDFVPSEESLVPEKPIISVGQVSGDLAHPNCMWRGRDARDVDAA